MTSAALLQVPSSLKGVYVIANLPPFPSRPVAGGAGFGEGFGEGEGLGEGFGSVFGSSG